MRYTLLLCLQTRPTRFPPQPVERPRALTKASVVLALVDLSLHLARNQQQNRARKEVSPRELIKRLSFKNNLRINEDDVVDIGVDGSLVEFYPRFEEYIREALREIPEVGPQGERKIRIGIAKDGSGVGAALIALVADKAMGGESEHPYTVSKARPC